jgi:hypothetical protein
MSTDETVRAAPAGDADDEGDDTGEPSRRRGGARRGSRRATTPPEVRFWHRDHPVFTPLAGFFTGVLLVVVVLGLLGALLDLVVGYDVGAHPWVFLVALGVLLVANLVLVVVGGTRRFARYMLFGVLTTPVVVVAVGALTLSMLIKNDG